MLASVQNRGRIIGKAQDGPGRNAIREIPADEGLRRLENREALTHLRITSEHAFTSKAVDRLRRSLPNIRTFRIVP